VEFCRTNHLDVDVSLPVRLSIIERDLQRNVHVQVIGSTKFHRTQHRHGTISERRRTSTMGWLHQ